MEPAVIAPRVKERDNVEPAEITQSAKERGIVELAMITQKVKERYIQPGSVCILKLSRRRRSLPASNGRSIVHLL